jgi:hypothetical protein
LHPAGPLSTLAWPRAPHLTRRAIPVPTGSPRDHGAYSRAHKLSEMVVPSEARLTAVRNRLSIVPGRASRIVFSPHRASDVALWFAFVALCALAVCLAVFLNAPTALRSVMTLAFVVFIPGLAIVRFLRLTDPSLRLSLAVATSLALDLIVSITMIYAGTWAPRTALIGIAAVAVGVAAIEAVAASVGPMASAAQSPAKQR